MRFLVLAGSVLFALSSASSPLKGYLRAILSYLLVTEFFLIVAGIESTFYATAYTVFTGLVLLCAAWMTWTFVRTVPGNWFLCACGLATGAFMGILARSGLQYGTTLGKAINTIEGAVMTALASFMGLCWISFVRQKRNPLIPGTMTVYWFLIGTYRLGWTLHDGALWDKLNWFIPSFLTVATMLWLGWKIPRTA